MDMIYAYVRISTQKKSQKTDRQLYVLEEYAKANGFEYTEIIKERYTGATFEREKYLKLRNEKLIPGSILVITDIDRLGRSATETIAELNLLKSRGCKVVPLDIPFMNEWGKVNDNSMYDMISDIYITLKTHIAQQELELKKKRINEGLAAAKKKGVKLGRPKAQVPTNFSREYRKYKNGEYGDMSMTNFAKMMGMARSTCYKYIDILEGK